MDRKRYEGFQRLMAEAAISLPKASRTEWEKIQPFVEAYNQAVVFYLHNTCITSFKMIGRRDVKR